MSGEGRADPESLRVHATSVVVDGAGVLILGPSGAGKSALGLELMALGARLVADDRTCLRRDGKALLASSPAETCGLIEARGVGILRTEPAGEVRLALAVDLGQVEDRRLPMLREWKALGTSVPLLHSVAARHFPAALMQYLRGGILRSE